MKRYISTIFGSFLLVAVAAAAHADTVVTWSAPVTDSGTAAEILTNGTVVAASSLYNLIGGADFTENGVTFTSTFTGPSFGLNGDGYFYGPTGSPDTADANYNNLLSYPLGGGGDFVIGNLTIGDTYQLEVLMPYFGPSGMSNPGASELVLSDGPAPDDPAGLVDASSPVLSGDPADAGQYITATFTADAGGVNLYSYLAADPLFNLNGGGNGVLGSAWVLSEVPNPTPEPGSLPLMGAALLGAGLFHRVRSIRRSRADIR